jgi:hypothetical protein
MTGLMSSSDPGETPAEVAATDNPATDNTDTRPTEVDAPNASAAKEAVKPASGKKPYRITVRTFADAYARRKRSYSRRKRVAYAARQIYMQGDHPMRSYYSRPA